MSQKEVISPPPAPHLPFSTVIAYGDLVFVAGLVGRDPETGEIAQADIASQTEQALKNIQRQLELAGTSLEQVLKVTVFILDMDLFGAMNEVYTTFFPTDPPARSCVEVNGLPDDEAMVEIEVVAAR
ncbi:MAG TPA: hypothetical protein ENN19_08760 [Chloroflexi bacterium]|nr:hypothetical protein [Chloroflexota bacterium]